MKKPPTIQKIIAQWLDVTRRTEVTSYDVQVKLPRFGEHKGANHNPGTYDREWRRFKSDADGPPPYLEHGIKSITTIDDDKNYDTWRIKYGV